MSAIAPSLECVPGKYNAGLLFSQLPMDGSGDFTVTRTTTPTAGQATRVNAAGLIELVPDNVPRLDYPLGGAVNGCPALLVEPSAQNLDPNSANFTGYILTNIGSPTSVTASNPFVGVTSVSKITPTAVSGQHRVFLSINLATTGRISAIVKADGYNFFSIAEGGGLVGQGTIFDLSSGTIATNAGGNPAIRNIGNGWYRCELDATITGNVGRFFIVRNANSTADYTGDGTSGILFCHKQIETGSVTTSPIVTSGGTITRGADVINKTNIASLIGQTEGTIYLEMQADAAGTGAALFMVGGASSNNIYIGKDSNRMRLRIRIGNVTAVDNQDTILNGSPLKIAVAYQQSGNCAAYVNGNFLASGTAGNFTAALTSIGLTDKAFLPFDTISAIIRIRAAALYTTRLPNVAQPGVLSLQSLTAI